MALKLTSVSACPTTEYSVRPPQVAHRAHGRHKQRYRALSAESARRPSGSAQGKPIAWPGNHRQSAHRRGHFGPAAGRASSAAGAGQRRKDLKELARPEGIEPPTLGLEVRLPI